MEILPNSISKLCIGPRPGVHVHPAWQVLAIEQSHEHFIDWRPVVWWVVACVLALDWPKVPLAVQAIMATMNRRHPSRAISMCESS